MTKVPHNKTMRTFKTCFTYQAACRLVLHLDEFKMAYNIICCHAGYSTSHITFFVLIHS